MLYHDVGKYAPQKSISILTSLLLAVLLALPASAQDGSSIIIKTSTYGYSDDTSGYYGGTSRYYRGYQGTSGYYGGYGTSGYYIQGGESWQASPLDTTSPVQTASSGGYGLWIAQTPTSTRNTYIQTSVGSQVPLITSTPAAGVGKLYDMWEMGSDLTGVLTSLNLPAGISQGSYQAALPGMHTLILRSGNWASNAVLVDVLGGGGYSTVVPKGGSPAAGWTGGNAGTSGRRAVSISLVSYEEGSSSESETGGQGGGQGASTGTTTAEGPEEQIFGWNGMQSEAEANPALLTFTIDRPKLISNINFQYYDKVDEVKGSQMTLTDQNGRTFGPWTLQREVVGPSIPTLITYPGVVLEAGSYTLHLPFIRGIDVRIWVNVFGKDPGSRSGLPETEILTDIIGAGFDPHQSPGESI